jgi:3-phenylpropionate/trans-cinnamate dioxygenase ferredoxin subunit
VSSHIVAVADQIPPGTRRLVEVKGREIGVFNVDGQFYAVRNTCPHQSGPLCTGLQVGALVSSGPGDYDHSSHGEVIQCPWHQWEFDVRTGQSWCDPGRVRARSYEAHVEPGAAMVASLGDDGHGSTDHPGKVPGPYVAEVYPVTVDHDYVVIDIG